jgi:hypothetical protein
VSDPSEDCAAMFEASLKPKRFERGQTIEGTIIDRRRGILLSTSVGDSHAAGGRRGGAVVAADLQAALLVVLTGSLGDIPQPQVPPVARPRISFSNCRRSGTESLSGGVRCSGGAAVKPLWLLLGLAAALLLVVFAADAISGGGHPSLSAVLLFWASYPTLSGYPPTQFPSTTSRYNDVHRDGAILAGVRIGSLDRRRQRRDAGCPRSRLRRRQSLSSNPRDRWVSRRRLAASGAPSRLATPHGTRLRTSSGTRFGWRQPIAGGQRQSGADAHA